MARPRGKARLELVADGARRQHGYGARAQMRVDGVAQPVLAPDAREVDMSDLPQRMHAGVGAAGAMHDAARAVDGENRLLQPLLHRHAIGLPLPADKRPAVIFDRQGVAGHWRAGSRFGLREASEGDFPPSPRFCGDDRGIASKPAPVNAARRGSLYLQLELTKVFL